MKVFLIVVLIALAIMALYTVIRYFAEQRRNTGDGAKACFEDAYKKIKKHLSPYIIDSRCDLDIAAVLFVVIDFAVYNNNGNRESVYQLIYPIAKSLTNAAGADLEDRIDFYGEFLRSKQPRCDFCFGGGNVDNGILRVIMALGDIIHNPNLIDDYDNEPVLIRDFFENVKLTETITKQVSQEIVAVFNYVSKCT